MRHVTRAEIEEIDRRAQVEFGIPAETLMERAGKAVADAVSRGPVVVLCGKGNNGGDGFVAARHLAERGLDVRVYAVAEPDPSTPAGRHRARLAIPVRPLGEFDGSGARVVVDALFGTGLRRPVEGEIAVVIRALNALDVEVVAVDIPSGLDADTGRPQGVAVKATLTVTMGLPKIGFKSKGAERFTGRVIVADIGYPPELVVDRS
jgi:NAD(P)H-hydrate epimerase